MRAKINNLYPAMPPPYIPDSCAGKSKSPGVAVWNPQKDIILANQSIIGMLLDNVCLPVPIFSVTAWMK